MYTRVSASTPAGTRIPDMDYAINPSADKKEKDAHKMVSSEPIVGFLYSVSKSAAGEFWPLHLGANTIGRDEDNEICLRELTVSGKHATLNIRRMKTTKEYLADIEIKGVNGGFVNDLEVRRDAECKSGDFITIGDNYVLYLILVNPFELGLKVAEGFQAAEENAILKVEEPAFERDNDLTGHMYDASRRVVGGTEGMDGSDSGNQGGFTSHML